MPHAVNIPKTDIYFHGQVSNPGLPVPEAAKTAVSHKILKKTLISYRYFMNKLKKRLYFLGYGNIQAAILVDSIIDSPHFAFAIEFERAN